MSFGIIRRTIDPSYLAIGKARSIGVFADVMISMEGSNDWVQAHKLMPLDIRKKELYDTFGV